MLEMLMLPMLALLPADEPVTTPSLRIESAWVREAPPVADVLAAYATLCNDSMEAVTVAGIESELFEQVEMHVTIERGDAVGMEQLESVVIEPEACVSFAPGGRHMMLFGPRHPVRAGNDITFTFQLADGREVDAAFPVRRADDMITHGHH